MQRGGKLHVIGYSWLLGRSHSAPASRSMDDGSSASRMLFVTGLVVLCSIGA
jgi:hypothetical protein